MIQSIGGFADVGQCQRRLGEVLVLDMSDVSVSLSCSVRLFPHVSHHALISPRLPGLPVALLIALQ